MGRRKITDEANSSQEAEDDEEREQLTQRMPKSLVNEVDDVSEELGISRNASVNLLVKKGLQNW